MCKQRLGAIMALFAIALCCAGCKSKINSENYAKIENGMTLDEVEHVLGKGTPVLAIDYRPCRGLGNFARRGSPAG